ncbi:MAG TPA: HlyD family efflux transporter periplasmic adaptor subunit [Cyclobacteriaceae bacterium]|jgi:HlyD family secretion protein|nr:HlyD family efflux transporter periplasmic adaptor subunit [Cyclobacteriaceae bacterium]
MEDNPIDAREIRSPEVQEIIGQTPTALTRWGITIIFILFVLLFALSWFIRYPDLLTAKVIISTSPAPVALVCRTAGNLILLKSEDAPVARGEMIGYIRSNTDPGSVLKLEKLLASNDRFSKYDALGSLGDLESLWSDVVKADESYRLYLENESYQKQIGRLKQQKNSYIKLFKTQEAQQKLVKQELVLIKEKFKTDSILFSQKVLSSVDFNQSKANWLQQLRNARSIETSTINTEIQIDLIEKQISDLEIKKTEDDQRLGLDIKSALNRLKAGLSKWKENYLFEAPIDGRLAYLGFLEKEQFLEAGKSYFSVIPDHGNILAKAELPVRGSGKVKEGQIVNIKLENYPYEQFGMLRGKVTSISAIPGNDNYRIMIELPQQLVTTQQKQLIFKQQLTGNTEIITEDLTLLDRFFQQFRGLLKR